MNEIPVLFNKKEECCGCGACLNVCPKQAISMSEDECGFIYPVIDSDKCIRCGKCKKVCAFQNIEKPHKPLAGFAAVSKNTKQAGKSASAGIFAAIATKAVESGGIVYGAAFGDKWKVHHISAENKNQIVALQGSKYVHSDTERTFSEIKEKLAEDRMVVFSGTPCQVAGLKAYLGKDYQNLLTVDIVCHGVPSNRMFRDYIRVLEKKYGGKAASFTFRDKSIGWGINGSVVINKEKKKIWQSSSSYLYYFTRGWLYRENCYKCPYACDSRPADITLGDYWGIEKAHPELLGKNGWDESRGISCVVVNTKKGLSFMDGLNIDRADSSFKKISAGNGQLRHPSSPGKRDEIVGLYRKKGWKALEQRFEENIGVHKYSSQIKSLLPPVIKRGLKRIK